MAGEVKVIITAPAETPFNIPVVLPIVAMEVLLEFHVPLIVVSAIVSDEFTHILFAPSMVPTVGTGFTVTLKADTTGFEHP